MHVSERMEEDLRDVLSYLASETMKARKSGKIDRAERLSVAFKILSKEYDEVRRQKEGKADR
jgi:hypothetical protein